MTTYTCPQCKLSYANFKGKDENGAHYACPDCNYTWHEEADEWEMNEDNRADVYMHASIGSMLDDLTADFNKYNLTPQQLLSISTLSMLVKNPQSFEVDGSITLTLTTTSGDWPSNGQIIQYDDEGLELFMDGSLKEVSLDENGNIQWHIYNEEETNPKFHFIDNFVADFYGKLNLGEGAIEIEDTVTELRGIE